MSRYCTICDSKDIVSPMIVVDVGDGDFISGQEFLCETCGHQEPLENELQERDELPQELSRS